MSRANERQVGGTHYQCGMQHWDIVSDHGVPYLLGCATKYLMRWRQKNGVEDLRKAEHFVEKCIDVEETGTSLVPPLSKGWPRPSRWLVEAFCETNELGALEAQACRLLLGAETIHDLEAARRTISGLIELAMAESQPGKF